MTDHTQVDHEAQKTEDVDGGVVDHRTVGKEAGLALKVKIQFQLDSMEDHLEMGSSLDLVKDGSLTWKTVGMVG
jgi:hypothetical protein